MNYSLPKSKNDYRIKHLPIIADERLGKEYPSLELKVDTISKVSGVPRVRVYQTHIPHIDEMFTKIITDISQMQVTGDPLKEIELDGHTFVLIDPEKAPAGWHADCAKSNFVDDPVRLACICYIPKGTFYGEVDRHDNLIHPIRDRYELFEKEFPLEAYIRLTAFFLPKFNKLMSSYTAKLRRENRNRKLTSLIGGRGKSFLMRFQKSMAFRGMKLRK